MNKKSINLENNKSVLLDTRDIMTEDNQNHRYKKKSLFSSICSMFCNKKPAIAILRLEGPIGKISKFNKGLSIESLNKRIEEIFKISKLDMLCLIINSPGGSPVQSALIAHRIRYLADKHNVKICSFVEDIAASGGYWLASIADEIFASRSSLIGSIGVVHSSFGFKDLIEKIGIERRVHTSGKNKSILDPFKSEKKDDINIIKKIQKEIHEHFIDTVKNNRKGKITQTDDILFNGDIWMAPTAAHYGLIDGIDDVYSFIDKKYGDNVKIHNIQEKQSFLQKKLNIGIDNIMQLFAKHLVNESIENIEINSTLDKYNKFL